MSRKIMKNPMRLIFVPLVVLWLSSQAFGLTLRIGASAGYSFVTGALFKELYGRGAPLVGGSLSLEFDKNFELRAEFNYVRLKGHMSLSNEDIALTMRPLVFAFRFRLVSGKFGPYIGSGINFIPYKEEYPGRIGDYSNSKAGIQLEGGSYIFLGPRIFLDLNFRYVFANVVQPLGDMIKLGGIRAGLGVGYAF